MATHLGCTAELLNLELAGTGSLIGAIVNLRGSGRSLRPYELPNLGTAMKWLADNELLDPDGPEEMFEPLTKRGLFRGRLKRTA
jgi:hypothetical protein